MVRSYFWEIATREFDSHCSDIKLQFIRSPSIKIINSKLILGFYNCVLDSH